MNAEIVALLAKASAILLGAAVIALLLRKASAAWRHFVWSTAMTSVIVLMLLQLIVPPIILTVDENSTLAAFAHTSQANNGKHVANASSEFAHNVIEAAATPSGEQHTGNRSPSAAEDMIASTISSTPRRETSTIAGRSKSFANQQAQTSGITDLSVAGATQPTTSTGTTTAKNADAVVPVSLLKFGTKTSGFEPTREQVSLVLLVVWATGTAILLLRLILAHWQVWRTVRASTVITEPSTCAALSHSTARLSIRTPVRLLMNARIATPCTAGWRNPVVMLPACFTDWDAARRTAVLTHEVAHIARRDSLSQSVASVACALFWFHPGFWIALRLLRAEGERAADDCVIATGMTPVDYADHLIAIAGISLASRYHAPAVAIGMARSSQLESRLRALLNTRQPRQAITSAGRRAFGVVTLFAVAPLAALQARVQEPKLRPALPVVVPAKQPPVVVQPRVQPPTVVPPAASAPARATVRPMMQPPVVLPATVSQNVGSQPLPSRATNAPPLPSRDVVAPALPALNVAPPPTIISPLRAGPPAVVRVDTTFEKTLSAVPGESLYVMLFRGGNVTVHGWDSTTARLRATVGGKSWRETIVTFERRQKRITLSVIPTEGTMEMTTGEGWISIIRSANAMRIPAPTTVDNEFELWVPRKTHIKYASNIGSLTLRDFDGDAAGYTSLGAVDITNAHGSANLVTENGDIRVASSSLSGSIHTGCGALNVANSGNALSATTAFNSAPQVDPGSATKIAYFEGVPYTDYCRLKLRGPRADRDLQFGPIAYDSVPNGGSLTTKSGNITVSSSGGVLTATTSNANIDIRRMGGDIYAVNQNGNIGIATDNSARTVHNIWVRATTGTVTLELPDSIDAEVDIEATYTEAYLAKFNRPARILDDRALPQTETAAWYRIDNNPLRKAVRIKTTLGKGNGRIYIRVIDGDVVLKRTR